MFNKIQKFLAGSAAFAVLLVPMTVPSGHEVMVAEQALEHAIVSLGSAVDPHTGKVVDGIAVIHYKKGYGHKDGHNPGKGKGGGDTTSTCYAFLANGAGWNNVEDYMVDATNGAGLAEADVKSLLAAGIGAWEAETSSDIFGSEVAYTGDGADYNSPDGKNEVVFADIDSPGAIAVTIVWGILRGPPSGRTLTEWDMEFDDVDFDWATDGTSTAMDFLNIAVHELGHALGLGHPSETCSDESMHRFASNGETKKRDLHAGDIEGVVALYGL